MKIISKPHPKALTAITVFILICMGISGYGFRAIYHGSASWFHLFAGYAFGGLAAVLAVRQLLSYKIITLTDKSVKEYHFFTGKRVQFALKQLTSWQETVISTKNEPFKQLKLVFDAKTIALSKQENTQYEKIVSYLSKRWPKKQLK